MVDRLSQNVTDQLLGWPQEWTTTRIEQNSRGRVQLERLGSSSEAEPISASSVEVVALRGMWVAKGNQNKQIKSTVSEKGLFGLWEGEHPLGLYPSTELNKVGAHKILRIFGLLQSVDGKALTRRWLLKNDCEGQTVPVVIDLSVAEETTLATTLNVSLEDLTAGYYRQVIRISGQDDKHPQFTVNDLDLGAWTNLADKVKKSVAELEDFHKWVSYQDHMFLNLQLNGIVGPSSCQTLDTLRKAGITTTDELANQDWATLTGRQKGKPRFSVVTSLGGNGPVPPQF